MRHLIHKSLFFFYCMFALLFLPINSDYITAMLLAVICACCTYFLNRKISSYGVSLLYTTASIFFPELILFFPLVYYDFFRLKLYVVWGVGVLAVFLGSSHLPLISITFTVLGMFFSYFIQSIAVFYEDLQILYKKTRDDGTELNLLLREKNRSLLERQDYEIYTATLRERNRIAREIHDNVGHMLSRSILMVGALKTTQKETPLNQPLTLLEETLGTAMDSIRESVHNIHDESVNLEETVQRLVQEFTFCPIQLTYTMRSEVGREMKYSFISILKEALANIMKHSHAASVVVAMEEFPGFYRLIIKDNGTAKEPVSYQGIGLLNMKERIEALSGHIRFTSDNGFTIFITVPKKQCESEAVL